MHVELLKDSPKLRRRYAVTTVQIQAMHADKGFRVRAHLTPKNAQLLLDVS